MKFKPLMSRFWSILKPVGIFLVKKNNPLYMGVIDAVMEKREINFDNFFEREKEIKEKEEKIIKESFDKDWEIVVINNADYSTLRTNYFTAEDIKSAKENFVLKNANPKYMVYELPKNFNKKKHGFFPIAFLDNNTVIRGGHSGHQVSTGFTHEIGLNIFPENILTKIKSICILQVNHEGNPRGVISRSNLMKVK